jgi:hypothetical protein
MEKDEQSHQDASHDWDVAYEVTGQVKDASRHFDGLTWLTMELIWRIREKVLEYAVVNAIELLSN